MGRKSPPHLTAAERRARHRRAARLARESGFVGRVEYRHVYSQTGGAQYGRGTIGGSLVIGPKKLSTVREELHRALAAASDDPIHWLEERMTSVELQGSAVSRGTDILDSLRRFIEAKRPRKSRKRRAGLEK
jgi:hypothetical protein